MWRELATLAGHALPRENVDTFHEAVVVVLLGVVHPNLHRPAGDERQLR